MDEMRPPPSPARPPPPARTPRAFSTALFVGILFLVAQGVFILQAHLLEDSPRRLTPVEGVTRYDLSATFGQQPLDNHDIAQRYGLQLRDSVCLSRAALEGVLAYREKPIPLSRAIMIRLRVRDHDGLEEFWLWPQE